MATTILLIDDEENFRKSIQYFLEDLDYSVITAENGELGVQRIIDDLPDLVLLDLCMPVMSGLAVLEKIHHSSNNPAVKNIPIIVVSGNGMMDDVVKALRCRAFDFITKPITDFVVLEHAITKAIQHTKLLKENQQYQQHLEEEIAKRTRRLNETFDMLVSEKARTDQALDCKMRFLCNMNHEFRTPINIILGYAEFLHENAIEDGNEESIDDILKIKHQSHHLLTMVSGMMDQIDIDPDRLKFESYTINQIISQVKTEIDDGEHDAQRLNIDLADDLPSVNVDASLLVRAILRLIDNAMRFSQEQVSLSAKLIKNGNIIIDIEDKGIGIAENELDNVFSPLYQVDDSMTRKHDGSGIGLSIAKQYIAVIGGSISVKSELAKGSVFSLTIPVSCY
ncbi:MAG: hybrid sensor histidine kinase/response regulator [Methylococcales bacterium]|jgi:signal transduction histidine kinase|nr:hybrid sensor histidine kinase/response regulator [Methylococcales bacterium]MBT7408084.1 hybrid sensor histidine kinase/response regulator [Methylococcales bacterium]